MEESLPANSGQEIFLLYYHLDANSVKISTNYYRKIVNCLKYQKKLAGILITYSKYLKQ